MNFQITLAPTKEIAIGMKISVLAILPHQMRSVRKAMTSPKKVASAGTTSSQRMLLKIDSRNCVSFTAQT